MKTHTWNGCRWFPSLPTTGSKCLEGAQISNRADLSRLQDSKKQTFSSQRAPNKRNTVLEVVGARPSDDAWSPVPCSTSLFAARPHPVQVSLSPSRQAHLWAL